MYLKSIKNTQHRDTKTTSKHSTREKAEMGRALANQGFVRDYNENTTCSAICRIIIADVV